ncbi:MAG: hypothetical protein Q9192_008161 [Flavoplaca navasiana]
MDLRNSPWKKRKPPGSPSFDPMRFILPLFDAYPGPERHRTIDNPELHPTFASAQDLPSDMLFIIPTIDFLMYEQLDLVDRLQREIAEDNKKQVSNKAIRRIEKMVFEGQWHGWLECTFPFLKNYPVFRLTMFFSVPSWAIDESTRQNAFTAACDFLKEVHRKNGFDIDQVISKANGI